MNMDFIPIIISIIALIVSIITFIRKQKSEQFRIALDIHNKLEQILNDLIQLYDDTTNKRSKSLEYLNAWEYFAFLVNNREIKNHNIHKFFKKSLCEDTNPIFQDYPDIANDNDAFEEVKKLRRKWACQNNHMASVLNKK